MSAIVFAGSSTSSEQEKQRDAAVSRVIKGVPIYRALKEDAVRGGCMLSAGELDSSKEYLQQPDGSWVVAYQVRHCASLDFDEAPILHYVCCRPSCHFYEPTTLSQDLSNSPLQLTLSQLPVADGHLCRQVGLIVQEGPSSPADATPEILFSSRRLWKLEIGPIKPGSIAKVSRALKDLHRPIIEERFVSFLTPFSHA